MSPTVQEFLTLAGSDDASIVSFLAQLPAGRPRDIFATEASVEIDTAIKRLLPPVFTNPRMPVEDGTVITDQHLTQYKGLNDLKRLLQDSAREWRSGPLG